MSSFTSALRFFQNLDRALLTLGYSAEIATVDFRGNSVYFVVEATGDIYSDEDVHATAKLTVEGDDNAYKARVYDANVDFYPYTKDELVREINAELPDKIGNLPLRPLDVARVLASQFKALGLEPANSINEVL